VLDAGIISDLIEAFPINALEKIEIIKGPGSVLYGSNAFSAVVNLIPRKAEHNGPHCERIWRGEGGKGTSGQLMIKRGSFSLFGAASSPKARLDDRLQGSTFLIGNSPVSPAPLIQTATLEDRGDGAYMGASYKNLAFMSSFTEWHAPSFVRGNFGSNKGRRGLRTSGTQSKQMTDGT
jgi:outer membrane receptor protein involved in Fe transport